MDQACTKAYGKVNIGLDVTGRRDDGYHLVKMILQTVDLYDEICVRKQEEGITVQTNKPFLPTDERNLAYKAAKMLMDAYDIPGGVRIDIGKNIPIAAGMAGGSTDAAAVLKLMNEIFELEIDSEEMDRLAVKLGADVPFCLRKGTYLAEGIGEELTKLPDMPHCYLAIINPHFGISTKWSYEQLDKTPDIKHPDIDQIISAMGAQDLERVSLEMGNVLERAALGKYPQIQEIKDKLKSAGALGTLMSGSGPTVFGIFAEEEECNQGLELFKGEAYGRFKSQL
ncbi:MAG: 4-(cytidine 5'-diphospho)-2-C-methyl-D-erythritol kinase [Lachnospiraceae bacterium]|nr:4-(cytidine 5'-diphospho)-2-C-methyl-D-erythritol kinase [Lachnospiraceae bacterium]